MQTRNIVKIFIASPGDLVEERRTAFKITQEFNRSWAGFLGYQVELVGWEDTVSSIGRPQDIINREMEQCELFYGLLSRRWGTPPSTDGQYASGFEEEFDKSLDSYRKTGRPKLKLAFKKVGHEFMTDIGPDLQKVIDFRQRIVTEKEILFEEFGDLADFSFRFRRALEEYVQSLHSSEQAANKESITGAQLEPRLLEFPVKIRYYRRRELRFTRTLSKKLGEQIIPRVYPI